MKIHSFHLPWIRACVLSAIFIVDSASRIYRDTVYVILLKTGSLDNAIGSRVFIGLAIMVYEPL